MDNRRPSHSPADVRKTSSLTTVIEALKTRVESRSTQQLKALKHFTHQSMPLLEPGYVSNDDYAYVADNLQYKLVP